MKAVHASVPGHMCARTQCAHAPTGVRASGGAELPYPHVKLHTAGQQNGKGPPFNRGALASKFLEQRGESPPFNKAGQVEKSGSCTDPYVGVEKFAA